MSWPSRYTLGTIATVTVALLASACGTNTVISASADSAPPTSAPYATSHPTAATPQSAAPASAKRRSIVLAAVGDISVRGGRQLLTSNLALSWRPSAFLALGDLQYPAGSLADFRRYYDPTWGRLKARTRPAPGNHEYLQPHASGYFSYFGRRATPQGHSYYSFNLNGWHLVALNSEIHHGPNSRQTRWLRADLTRNSQRCVLAYWHRPRFSSGLTHGPDRSMAPFWAALYGKRADIVLNGHEHNYERFGRQNASATATASGIRQFVVGTGGNRLYPFGARARNSQVRLNSTVGVLKLTLSPNRYGWAFVSTTGRTLDSGSGSCH